jgi:hypothetical protein
MRQQWTSPTGSYPIAPYTPIVTWLSSPISRRVTPIDLVFIFSHLGRPFTSFPPLRTLVPSF